jgi:hypothetical protein
VVVAGRGIAVGRREAAMVIALAIGHGQLGANDRPFRGSDLVVSTVLA